MVLVFRNIKVHKWRTSQGILHAIVFIHCIQLAWNFRIRADSTRGFTSCAALAGATLHLMD